MASYLGAWQHTPDRAERSTASACTIKRRASFTSRICFSVKRHESPRPGADRLFVEYVLYDMHIPLEYAVACYYVGRHAEALAVNDRLLAARALSPELDAQVRRNRQFSLDAA